jgi:hypothetical protein
MFRKLRESTFLRNDGKCPRAQPLGKFLKISDSIALYSEYTKNVYNTSFADDANRRHQQASNEITEILQ